MEDDMGHTGGLINRRLWRGRCRAGYSNTGGPPLPRKRGALSKKCRQNLVCLGIFFSILLTHEGSHREAYRDFQPNLTSSAGGAKGCSDHRFRAPPAYTAQLPTLHQHRANNQYRTCLLYTSPSPRDRQKSRMPSSA